MDDRWLIIADDLTGAADTAIAFAKRRLPAHVAWSEADVTGRPREAVLAIDADSRRLPGAAAARRHREILERLFEPGTRVIKKMDSTLRGHPAEEIAALTEVLTARDRRPRVIFAPAFPAGGRVTRAGRVWVHGIPLEHTEFWDAHRPAQRADLPALLAAAGMDARLIPLDEVRGAPQRLRAAFDDACAAALVCVCDAEAGEDLDLIAAAALDDTPSLFVGSAGLAHSLASRATRTGVTRMDAITVGPSARGALLIVGSQAGPSRTALPALASVAGVRRVSVVAADLLAGRAEESLRIPELARELAAGTDLLVDVAPPAAGHAIEPDVVDALVRCLRPLAASASAWMATGGDTARAVLSHGGARGIRLVDEIEPGTSLGLTLGGVSLPVITKSGGFGDAGSLRRILERLRSIRKTGTVA